MASLTLLIGDRATSAASLQAWMIMRQAGLTFETRSAAEGMAGTASLVSKPAAPDLLPVLLVDTVPIWDALAIGEFIAEHVPGLWPDDPRARAIARSIVCELHGGLRDLQTFLPLDMAHRFGPPGKLPRSVERDLTRVATVWEACRLDHGKGGPFLFGPFSLVDAMYAPIVARIAGHGIALDPVSERYVETVMALPAMIEWLEEVGRKAVKAGPVGIAEPASVRTPQPSDAKVASGVPPSPAESEERPPAASSPFQPIKPIGTGTRRRH